MGDPKNASISGEGFRFYIWKDANTGEETHVLSVTSIRKLCGESYQLVAWQISNVVNVAMGMTKRTTIGPRGGVKETYVKDGEFPGAFARQLAATNGEQGALDRVRAWLRETADKPRDTAAARGSIVHEAIELGASVSEIDTSYVEKAVERLSSRDRKKMKSGVTDEDVSFVRFCVGQYWDMRVKVPFVILAKEPQVWNLTAGYAGSADVLIWFLPGNTPLADIRKWQERADKGEVTQADIARVGGHVCLGDWKTAKGVYTDNVIQVHAYLAVEFIGADGVVDVRLTEIINAADKAAIVHIRPDGWTIHYVDFTEPVLYAFLGSVAYARFIAANPEPLGLFTHDVKGAA